ncbi:MAG: YggS family pyridoxal phosphate-dependent enzyme [Ruminococcaceae bacterium]|nr:YggS family pyridoxal phosphate-dependent enzyme [Oscillospiraceae bacterium]
MNISENLYVVKKNIALAAEKSGRKADDVRLIAVTKTVGCDDVAECIRCGHRDFGENRVQVLQEKLDGLKGLPEFNEINWHLIGHLQSNKVKYCANKVSLIHSVDKISLAQEISRFAQNKGIDVHCLLQLNVSGEESKSGLDPLEINKFIEEFAELKRIYIDGLMTMAPIDADDVFLHKIFAKTRELSVDIDRQKVHNMRMMHLSMGMSGDYECAIEEGATMVRVGTAIFH